MIPENKNITLPIKDVVHGFLGYGYTEKTPIPRHIAEIIFQHLQNKSLAYIQFEDEDTLEVLEKPILWDYGFWVNSTERWLRQRAYCEREREAEALMRHNVSLIAPYLANFLGMEDAKKCESRAYDILKNNKHKQLKIIGFDLAKLITEYKNIP